MRFLAFVGAATIAACSSAGADDAARTSQDFTAKPWCPSASKLEVADSPDDYMAPIDVELDSVIDGDTLEIHGQRIRLLDIDAPEKKQTCTRPDGTEWCCGQQVALKLFGWIGDRVVTGETERKDQYRG